MQLSRTHAGIIGAVFWGGLMLLIVTAVQRTGSTKTADAPPLSQLVDFAVQRPLYLQADLPAEQVRRGDPIFSQTPVGWKQLGYLDRIDSEAATARVVWYATDVDPYAYELDYYRNRGKFDDVLETLLPPEKRQRIQDRISQALREHGDEVTAAFRPVVEQSLKESAPVLEDALKASIEAHEEEFKQIGKRWEEDILKKRIVPLLREEVLPTVRQHGEPLAQTIGRELWDRASIWRFGWRALYDKSPLPEKDMLKREWERFVEREAIPVFESHMDDIIEAQKKIVVDISENEKIRDEVETVFKEMAGDKPFQDLMKAVVRESVIDNKQLHAIWTRNFKSDQARAAIELAGERLEPIVREIGDDLFGTKEDGIDPDFARVLRNQILGKDKRWIIAIPKPVEQPADGNSDTSRLVVRRGTGASRFPLVIMAGSENTLNGKE